MCSAQERVLRKYHDFFFFFVRVLNPRGRAAGFVFGGLFGLFIAGTGPQPFEDPTKMKVRETIQAMGKTSFSYAKNFALVGGVYSVVECTIESVFCFRIRSPLCLTRSHSIAPSTISTTPSAPDALREQASRPEPGHKRRRSGVRVSRHSLEQSTITWSIPRTLGNDAAGGHCFFAQNRNL